MKVSNLSEHIENKFAAAEFCLQKNMEKAAFRHLGSSHILGQSSTYEHFRIHWRMLKFGWRLRDVRETWGQIVRIAGAVTKTPFGIYPTGNWSQCVVFQTDARAG